MSWDRPNPVGRVHDQGIGGAGCPSPDYTIEVDSKETSYLHHRSRHPPPTPQHPPPPPVMSSSTVEGIWPGDRHRISGHAHCRENPWPRRSLAAGADIEGLAAAVALAAAGLAQHQSG